jgi:hypothetical protein
MNQLTETVSTPCRAARTPSRRGRAGRGRSPHQRAGHLPQRLRRKAGADAAVTPPRNGVAAVVLIAPALHRWRPGLPELDRRRWPAILAVGAIGGSILHPSAAGDMSPHANFHQRRCSVSRLLADLAGLV